MIRNKADSKGHVFYLQERIGRYGRPFNIIQVQTMFEGPKWRSPTEQSQ
jgi:lipopolysaccharide/colanic/teichoic acid biosynthesis glycosyltransferase